MNGITNPIEKPSHRLLEAQLSLQRSHFTSLISQNELNQTMQFMTMETERLDEIVKDIEKNEYEETQRLRYEKENEEKEREEEAAYDEDDDDEEETR